MNLKSEKHHFYQDPGPEKRHFYQDPGPEKRHFYQDQGPEKQHLFGIRVRKNVIFTRIVGLDKHR